ncbi:MAG: TolC family protein [bacterium]
MKKILILLFSVIFAAGLVAESNSDTPLAFSDCYKLAIANSDAVKIQVEKLNQANLAKLKAVGNMLPNIGITHTRDFGLTSVGAYSDQGWESAITAKQTIFYGFQKINLLSMYDREAYKEELNLISVKRTLAQNTALVYYALASAQADLINVKDSLSYMNDRVTELHQWEKMGKSRPSELYAAQSKAALIASQLEQAKAVLGSAVDALDRVIGSENIKVIVQPIETDFKIEYFNITFTADNRSDILAQKAEVEAQGKKIDAGLGAMLPQVDLSVSKTLGGTPYLGTSAYKDNGWQFMLLAQWPIFEGGTRIFDSIAAFSQKEAAYRQYVSNYLDVKYELKSKLRDYKAADKIVIAMKDAYAKATQSLRAQVADYKNGLVTNVDVIQAMLDAASVKQSLDRAIVDKEKDKTILEISAEIIQ